MAYGDNPILALFDPAENVTAAVTAAVTSGKFVKIGGTLQGGPILDLSTPTGPMTKGNLLQVTACGAGDKAVGITKWDTAAADDVVGLYTGGQIAPMAAGANITAGAEVEANASSLPIPLASGKANGIACSTATSGNVVYIKLYN